MLGIHIAAVVTTLLSLAVIGGLLAYHAPRARWAQLGLALVLQLPMSLIAFALVRTPYDHWLQTVVRDPDWLGFLRMFNAPLTEEPAKIWPLLIPWLGRCGDRRLDVQLAVALGLGFGIGEIWLLAELLAEGSPEIARLPWYQLGGFINERFMVCVLHGAFTSAVLVWGVPRGLPLAMGLHFLGNFPIYLKAIQAGNLSAGFYTVAINLWITGYFLALTSLMLRLAVGNWNIGRAIFGDATCPGCGAVYPRPLLALNLGTKRYERCPHCRRWHLL